MLKRSTLSPSQQLVVWSARTWVACARLQRPALDALAQAHAFAGVGNAAQDIDELFGFIVVGARRCLSFGAPHCPCLHPCEAALINCLCAYQSGKPERASQILLDLLHPAAARLAAPPARRWADALAHAGWSLDRVATCPAADRRLAGAGLRTDGGASADRPIAWRRPTDTLH